MTDAPRYKVATLGDMVAIPDEALPRFLAELPAILSSLRDAHDAAPSIAERTVWPWWLRWLPLEKRAELIRKSMMNARNMTWIDDDKQTATVSVRLRPGDPTMFSETRKMGDAA